MLAAITAEDLVSEPDKSVSTVTAAAHPSYKGTRIRLDDDDNDGDDPISSKARTKKRSKDRRTAAGGISVKLLRQKQSRAGRGVSDKVSEFLSDHFYGERLRRTTGPANRRRGNLPARVFAVKS